MDKSSPIISTT